MICRNGFSQLPEDSGIGSGRKNVEIGVPGRGRAQGPLPQEEEGDGDPGLEAGAQLPDLGGDCRVGVDPEPLGDLDHHVVAGDVPLGHEAQALRHEARLHGRGGRGSDDSPLTKPPPEVIDGGLRRGAALRSGGADPSAATADVEDR